MSDQTPREWNQWDPEPPADVQQVCDREGFLAVRAPKGGWLWMLGESGKGDVGMPWPFEPVKWPLTEVLPEQAEPRTLLGWSVPDHIEFSYTVGLSIGMFISCPRHAFGPLQENYLYPVERDARIGAFLKRHAHDETVAPPSQSPQDAPNAPSPVSLGGGGAEEAASGELSPEIAKVRDLALTEMVRRHGICLTIEREWSIDVALALIAAQGWRPPSTQDETEYRIEFTASGHKGRLLHQDVSASEVPAWLRDDTVDVQQRSVSPWVSVSSVEGDKP